MIAALLTLVFTPLGFWYKGQTTAGFLWLVAAIFLGVATGGISLIFTIPGSMVHAASIGEKS